MSRGFLSAYQSQFTRGAAAELRKELDHHNHLYYVEAGPRSPTASSIASSRNSSNWRRRTRSSSRPTARRSASAARRSRASRRSRTGCRCSRSTTATTRTTCGSSTPTCARPLGRATSRVRRRAEDRRRRRCRSPTRTAGWRSARPAATARSATTSRTTSGPSRAVPLKLDAKNPPAALRGARRGLHDAGRARPHQRSSASRTAKSPTRTPQPHRRDAQAARPEGVRRSASSPSSPTARGLDGLTITTQVELARHAEGIRLPGQPAREALHDHRRGDRVLPGVGREARRPALRHRRHGHQGERLRTSANDSATQRRCRVGEGVQVRGRAGDHASSAASSSRSASSAN